MQRYGDWRPTGFDARGAFLENREDWLVLPVIRTHDSGVSETSNFECAWSRIEDASVSDDELSCESRRFGHWACGWFEIILVRPGSHCAAAAERIEAALDSYPVLDEVDHSTREWEYACESWRQASIRERVEMLQDAGGCIFAARRDEFPDDPNGRIFERCSREC